VERALEVLLPWGGALVAGFGALSLFLLYRIATGRSGYPRRAAWGSPAVVACGQLLLVAVLPSACDGLRVFLLAAVLNLPLLVFHVVTAAVLRGSRDLLPAGG
jgi:hypothetical protein